MPLAREVDAQHFPLLVGANLLGMGRSSCCASPTRGCSGAARRGAGDAGRRAAVALPPWVVNGGQLLIGFRPRLPLLARVLPRCCAALHERRGAHRAMSIALRGSPSRPCSAWSPRCRCRPWRWRPHRQVSRCASPPRCCSWACPWSPACHVLRVVVLTVGAQLELRRLPPPRGGVSGAGHPRGRKDRRRSGLYALCASVG